MNLQEIEEIRKIANQIAEKLTPEPASILKTEFQGFYREVHKTLSELVVSAYMAGELVPTIHKENIEEVKE